MPNTIKAFCKCLNSLIANLSFQVSNLSGKADPVPFKFECPSIFKPATQLESSLR